MAKKRRKKAVARRNAGHPRKRRSVKVRRHRTRRMNPGNLGSPKTWLVGGAGVLAGVFVTRGAPQLLLGSSNTGAMGYAANAATAVIGGWAIHSFMRNPLLSASFIAGGFASLIARLISDYTPYGSKLALSGWGDYQFSNIVGTVPQRLIARDRAVVEWGAPAGPADRVSSGTGGDFRLTAGQC